VTIAPYPAYNSESWDVPLKNYIDSSIAANVVGAADATSRAVSLKSLPDSLSAIAGYNIAPWSADNVVTAGGYQYVVYWNSSAKPIIGRWNLTTGVWSSFDLSTITGNPLASPAEVDGHNNLAMAVDANGYIHVSGNHHDAAGVIHYIRSTNPNDITAWSAPGMAGGVEETAVTYPCFFQLPDNTLLFVFRYGGAGVGDLILYRYNTSTTTWTKVTTLIDGRSSTPTVSPYWNHLAVDSAGALHLFWNWRTLAGGGDANHNLNYMKVTGLGIGQTLSATKSTGVTQTIPPTPSNCEVVIAIPDGSGMTNTTGACVDSDGHPHTVITKDDSSSFSQYVHVWHNGTSWQQQTLTQFTTDVDWVSASSRKLCRPALAAYAGRVLMIYRTRLEGKQEALWMADITNGPIRSEYPICRIDIGDESPTYDTRALRDSGQLNMLLTIQNGDIGSQNLAAPAMSVGYGGILSVNLLQAGKLNAGTARVPGLRTIAYDRPAVGTAGFTITATTQTGLPDGFVPLPWSAGVRAFVRFNVRMKVNTSGDTVNVRLVQDGVSFTTRTIALATTGSTAYTFIQTPWMPLDPTPNPTWLTLSAAVTTSTAGTATLQMGSVEIAILDEI
jgi:hypothetical protein